ncbi:hypothetical protein GCM10027598_58560 [Amycolatopsis oliviviridis]|uniref:Uncharacterized protein n=1 Tax=Amycolatopsis oliviviridis TaxID=1471590 RepID=A0ABQ3LX11_9PSEU|nr:S8 family peptidase [Amycolatopsis oliviviridis]GHH28416.1 hypothetical protein GCM10017790_59210 [Amycolatopsis oliviviridis]
MRTIRESRRLTAVAVAGVAAVVLGVIAAAPARAAEGRILAAGSAEAVPDSYIVTLKDTGSVSTLADRFGAKVDKVYSSSLIGFSATMSERQAKRLAADPSVASVEQNQRVHADDTQTDPPSWGLDRVDQSDLPFDQRYGYTTTGAGVNVYVIDTGVRIGHETFGGRAHDGHDFVDDDAVAQDGHGHGTHVAGTIAGAKYGIAKGATIYGVRVLDDSGSGTTAGVVAGIDWVTQNHVKPAVANMSLGGSASSTLDGAVRRSIAAGVTYGIAAGNSNAKASNYSPARVTEAITVGSSTKTDSRSGFSNYGDVVDIFAPGTDITSSWNTDDSATKTISGTSMATPHVVGMAARYLQNDPDATPDKVATALIDASIKDKLTNPGAGSPNRLLYAAPTS